VDFNVGEILKHFHNAESAGTNIVLTPELSVTGYTCGDLFSNDSLLEQSEKGLERILEQTKNSRAVLIVGAPVKNNGKLFNCAVVCRKGEILGVVPKTYIPNYGEFYEMRYFTSNAYTTDVTIGNITAPFGANLIFRESSDIAFGVEICEDLWAINPPSNKLAENGANLIFNLSASNDIIGKPEFRRNLIMSQSARLFCAYIYASCGPNESSSDLVFGGHAIIAENGVILAENQRFNFGSSMITTDINAKRLANYRRRSTTFKGGDSNIRNIPVEFDRVVTPARKYSPTPFVPKNPEECAHRCEEILNIQATGLAQRLRAAEINKCVLGLSGGLDSALAFLVINRAFCKLGIDISNLIAVTMPGLGTGSRTLNNAVRLAKIYGATLKNVDINPAVNQHFSDISLNPDVHNTAYENAQARERTQILMDIANQENALVVGTSDLSELALGWCTYNGDHMSMYSVNCSVPKTLVRCLTESVAEKEQGEKAEILRDILGTPASPELLPPDESGAITQITENKIGPYELHDFFLYHHIRGGENLETTLMLAQSAFEGKYAGEEIRKWLEVFVNRFYRQQFKRNCMPDGPKIGTVSLSPRGDWRAPSDISINAFSHFN
jgi:NAD+ synthase (glutamine-hydrolysing)